MTKQLIVKTGRPAIYPYEKWTNGKIHTIVRVQDYHCTDGSIRAALRNHAGSIGRKVRIKTVSPGIIQFQFEVAREK